MAEIKIRGDVSGSTTIKAPDSGSDEIIELSSALASKLSSDVAASTYLPIAGGKILQVVRATDSTERSTTSTSFTDASISVTITPQKNDSVVVLFWSAEMRHSGSSDFTRVQITDNSNNAISGAEGSFIGSSTTNDVITHVTLVAYSTPAITSATTYKGRFRVASTGTATLRNQNSTGQMYAIEVSA